MVGRILAQGYLAYLAGTKEKGLAAALGSLNNSQCISKVFISYQFISPVLNQLWNHFAPSMQRLPSVPKSTPQTPSHYGSYILGLAMLLLPDLNFLQAP